jgi:hypothetical protein
VSAGPTRREVGHTRDARWEIGVSKTIHRPVDEVWDFITSPAGVAVWLGEGVTLLSEQGAGYETITGVQGETRPRLGLTAVDVRSELVPCRVDEVAAA